MFSAHSTAKIAPLVRETGLFAHGMSTIMSISVYATPGSQGSRNISGKLGAEKMRNSGMICIYLLRQLMREIIELVAHLLILTKNETNSFIVDEILFVSL